MAGKETVVSARMVMEIARILLRSPEGTRHVGGLAATADGAKFARRFGLSEVTASAMAGDVPTRAGHRKWATFSGSAKTALLLLDEDLLAGVGGGLGAAAP
ncbi:MAG: hypothetical protein FJX64_09310 [Alphaproteobacteria bacterium]|nr:hypothetical protein [Alphaproteobacteria bacterium]MBM4437933.1 hypothetical protein [Actinomycetota bacterium]